MDGCRSEAGELGCIEVGVLGPFSVVRDGRPLDTARWQRRPGSLLRMLTVSPGQRRTRDEVIDAFWPAAPLETGGSNLRLVVHMLRRGLGGGEPSPILTGQGWVGLNPSYRWEVDLLRFDQGAARLNGDPGFLEALAALYRGEPLGEDRYEEWAIPIRERVLRSWRDLRLRLADQLAGRGKPDGAVHWLQSVLEDDPLDEEALRALLEALAALGRRTEALRTFRKFELKLREELDVSPEPATSAVAAGLVATSAEVQEEVEPPGAPPDVTPRYPLPTTPPLVGRQREIEAVVTALDDEAGPRLILLEAEAGMGKTRMLGEIAGLARDRGMLVLAGGAYEHEGRLPYGPIHDALLDYVRTETPGTLRRRFGPLLTEISRLVPELRGESAEPEAERPVDGGDQRLRLFSAVAEALERLSGARRLMLILDDLQWADDATLHLLHYLLRQPSLCQVVVVAAFREDEIPRESALHQLSEEAAREGFPSHLTCLSLSSLGAGDMTALLEERLEAPCTPRLLQAVQERSAGNPFLAVQLARLLRQEARVTRTPAGWDLIEEGRIELPAEVQEVVARRLRQLQPNEQEVLAVASVLGRQFVHAPLESMWEGSRDALFASLQAVDEARLLIETADGYAFRHPLLRDVVYQRIPARRRAVLHFHAARILEGFYGREARAHAPELAYHFVEAGPLMTGRALFYLEAAGDAALQAYAGSEALSWYTQALALAGEEGPELLEKLGTVLGILARYDEALATLEKAAALRLAQEDGEGALRVLAQIGRIHAGRGTPALGISRLEAAAASSAAGAKAGEAEVQAGLAHLYFVCGRYEDSVAAAERASELAHLIGNEAVLAEAQVQRGVSLASLGRGDHIASVLEEAVTLTEALGDLPGQHRALSALAVAYYSGGELEQGKRYRERQLEVARRTGDPGLVGFATGALGYAVFLLGDWERARCLFQESLELTAPLGPTWASAYPLLNMGLLLTSEGQFEEGSRYLDQAAAVAEQIGDLQALRHTHSRLAERDLMLGRAEEAVARLQPLLDRPGHREKDVTFPLLVLAWAYLELGQTGRAEQIAREGVERSRLHDLRLHLLQALRVQGTILRGLGRQEEAEASLTEALGMATSMRYPYGAARVMTELGRLYLEEGHPEKARPLLEEAHSTFERLGARPYAQQAEELLHTMSTPDATSW